MQTGQNRCIDGGGSETMIFPPYLIFTDFRKCQNETTWKAMISILAYSIFHCFRLTT